ncbi:MAG: phospho-N-acetylmuramoyl-pentapeptide-transferase [Clostridia bacterium]|nr:phospho-N-acetylmuramoyl-pentapeptide-transferase [Clostridia bacterium]
MNTIAAFILSAVVAFAVTALLGIVVIPWLHKLKFGQTILDIGPNWHKQKQGTPTMGGIMFMAGTVIAVIITVVTDKLMGGDILAGEYLLPLEIRSKLISGLLMAFAFGIVGFADDYIKVVKKRNLGLSIMQKTVAQVFIIAAYLVSLYMSMGKQPYMYIPFIGNVEMGIFFWILGAAVIYATINAVNFTDGIDGLCSSVTLTAAVAFVVISVICKLSGVGVVASALAGGCAGFLVWNRNPAKVFMGDTGYMFLGGLVVALAYAINCPLILLCVGIIYVIEGLSDVIQIGYFKLTHGKRIFKMAPIHHHFEMSGWSEKKIVTVFSAVNIIGSTAGILIMYFAAK